MVNERYTIIKKWDERQWTEDCCCKIVFDKAALLVDNKKDTLLLQCKFQNISSETVIGMQVEIKCLDVTGDKVLDTVIYSYLDLTIKPGEYFGSDKAITLNSKDVRNIEVRIIEQIFQTSVDRNIYVFSRDNVKHQTLNEVGASQELTAQANREQQHLPFKIDFMYNPIDLQTHWYCSCGQLNIINSCVNPNCKCPKDIVVNSKLLDSSYIMQKLEQYNHECALKKSEEEKIKEERQAKVKRKIKKISIIAGIIALLIIGFWFYKNNIAPQMDYNRAMRLLEQDNYEEARKILDALSEEDIPGLAEARVECSLIEANTYFANKEYSKALDVFNSIKNEREVQEKIFVCQKELVNSQLENGDVNGALTILRQMNAVNDEQKASLQELTTAVYGKLGQDCLSEGDLEGAYNYFLIAEDDAMISKTVFELAKMHYNNQAYEKALDYLENIEGTEEVNDLIVQCEAKIAELFDDKYYYRYFVPVDGAYEGEQCVAVISLDYTTDGIVIDFEWNPYRDDMSDINELKGISQTRTVEECGNGRYKVYASDGTFLFEFVINAQVLEITATRDDWSSQIIGEFKRLY